MGRVFSGNCCGLCKLFSDDFRGNRNQAICLNSINIRSKIWGRSLWENTKRNCFYNIATCKLQLRKCKIKTYFLP